MDLSPALQGSISTNYRHRDSPDRTEESSQNYYIENPSASSVVWSPTANTVQQQKRFLVNFVFIDFFFWDKLDLLNPKVDIYIYLYIAFSIGKTYIRGGETFLKCPLLYSTEHEH